METKTLIHVSGLAYGRTSFQVTQDQTEDEIKHIINQRLEIPEHAQRLVFQKQNGINISQILQREREVELSVVVNMRGGTHVIIVYQDGRQVPIDVDLRDTRIIKIKEQIQEQCGQSPQKQILKYKGRVLENELKIGDFTDQSSPKLELLFQIETDEVELVFSFIENPRPVRMTCKKKTTIKEVKNRLSEQTGKNKEEMKLSHNGELLHDQLEIRDRLNSRAFIVVDRNRHPSEYTSASEHKPSQSIIKPPKCKGCLQKLICCGKKKAKTSYVKLPEQQ